MPFLGSLVTAHMWYMDIHAGKTPIYITIKWKTKPNDLWAFVEMEESGGPAEPRQGFRPEGASRKALSKGWGGESRL